MMSFQFSVFSQRSHRVVLSSFLKTGMKTRDVAWRNSGQEAKVSRRATIASRANFIRSAYNPVLMTQIN